MLKHLNSSFIQPLVVLKTSGLQNGFSFSLISKTFRMPQLCILWCDIKCSIVIFMSCDKVLVWLPIQENVTPIKVNSWIIWIFLNSIIKILFGIFLSINMIVSQSLVIIMYCSRLKTNCLVVMNESIFKFSFFEVR